MHKAFPLPGESSQWQYKFPLPVEGVPTASGMEIPLPGVCTVMMKKLPVRVCRGIGCGVVRDKREFICRGQVAFLGHIMSADGITMDLAKVEAISKWLRPKTVTEIRSFLGPRSYYRIFVEGFSRLALLLSKLMRKSEKFVWDEEREKSFEELKNRLVSPPPILSLHSGSGGFQIYSDASKKGLGKSGMLANLQIEPEIIRHLKHWDIELCIRAQKKDVELWAVLQKSEEDEQTKFWVYNDGVMWFGDRLCVPSDPTLREAVLSEAHSSPFFIHPGSTKMYGDLKQHFWWNGMKQDISMFVGKCLICQHIKFEHQRASRLLQPLDIPVWKWDEDEYLYLVEFAYNNSWHASIKAAPYDLLYGRKCRTPICWNEVGERVIDGPELIEVTNKKVTVAKEKLKEARGV
nr:hypothetical protein [Tanacetum cinerariifolium]